MIKSRIDSHKIHNYFKLGALSLFAAAISLLCCRTLYAESLGELTTTMALEGELNNSITTPAASKAAQDANSVTPKPTNAQDANVTAEVKAVEKLSKTALKLYQSMQSGQYERADFSAVWNTVVPQNMNFSDGINAILKPALDILGKAEQLGEGKLVGDNKAVFPVRFTGGTANMTVSHDQEGKIVEWMLTPQVVTPAPYSAGQIGVSPQTQERPSTASEDANLPDIKDFNSFQRELNRINIETRSEEQQWLGNLERKEDLIRSIDELVAAELRFIQKLAESEHAPQTVKAVELVLRQRQDRLNKLITKLNDVSRAERREQGMERRPRRTRAEGEEPTPRRQRRVREPNSAGQQ